MDYTNLELTEFKKIVETELLMNLIGKTFEECFEKTNEFLDPYIEAGYIESFDTLANEDLESFSIEVFLDNAPSLLFQLTRGDVV